MKEIQSKNIKETAYIEKLENGLEVIIIPKKNATKKYVIWTTKFGSIDNKFVVPQTKQTIEIPDGVAHFLEHKMFEQKDGTNSLDTLMALGIDANAYTTNDHTSYLFECTDHFYEGLDELMDYVQNPYFTDENVEKEKNIIAQEIRMYDDDPSWQLYMGAMECLYEKNPIKLDIAGTVESISKITPEILYNCYNTFYNPSNMVLVVVGDFVPEEILRQIKQRLKKVEGQGKIERIYPEEKKEINQKRIEKEMEVTIPIFMIGIKDYIQDKYKEIVKRHVAIEIILNMLIGPSSKLYQELYESGDLLSNVGIEYEYSKQYAHASITGGSNNIEKVYDLVKKEIEVMKQNPIDEAYFERIKKKIYGDYAVEYNSVANIGRMFAADNAKGVNSFEYMEKFDEITTDYLKQVLEDLFKEENMVISIIKSKK